MLSRIARKALYSHPTQTKRFTRPCWPTTGEDGRPAWPQGPRPDVRIYTIVLHEGTAMPGACFAAGALPGCPVGMKGQEAAVASPTKPITPT